MQRGDGGAQGGGVSLGGHDSGVTGREVMVPGCLLPLLGKKVNSAGGNKHGIPWFLFLSF